MGYIAQVWDVCQSEFVLSAGFNKFYCTTRVSDGFAAWVCRLKHSLALFLHSWSHLL